MPGPMAAPPTTAARTTTAPAAPGAVRSPARTWLMVLGWVLVAIAILGLLQPAVDLMHKLTFHIEEGEDVVHWLLAVVTLGLAYGVKDQRVLATLTIVYGAVYLLVGLAGFFVGTPDAPVAGWHVGPADNLLHLALGVITVGAGLATRKATA